MTGPSMTGTTTVAVAAQQAAPEGPGIDAGFFLMMGAIFAIFYFLVLRPQQKKQRALEDSVKKAAKGDLVITAGGLHGKIVATEDDVVTIEIATVKGGQAVRVQVSRSKIESVTKSGGRSADKSADQSPAKKGEGS